MEKSGRVDEVNGTANPANKESVVQSTYKKLPEEDTNWQQPKDEREDQAPDSTMVKQNGTDPEVEDEANERMLQDDVKLSPKKDNIEVKYISENGDAKIDLGTVKEVLSGMGKEELMKFANDPFWIRLRWFLFIAFWVLWAAMLAGAVAIIVIAPKCNSPEPIKWWQESPIIHLDEFDTSNHKLKDMEELIYPLEKLNIKTLSLSSILETDQNGQTTNFRGIRSNLGTIDDLKSFIRAAESKGKHVILELDPNHSSVEHKWFKESVARNGNYSDYYVWRNAKSENGVRSPPNNWLNVYGGSAWEWNEQRGQYYLHQFNKTQPDLNFLNPNVVKEFEEIYKYWLNLGFNGFRLENVQFLTEDPEFSDEEGPKGIPGTYDSLNHVRTRERTENEAILRQWRNIVLNITDGEGLFTLRDDISPDVLQVFNDHATSRVLIDLPQSSHFLTTAKADLSATTIHTNVSKVLAMSEWPAWDINGNSRSLRSRVTEPIAESITLMVLLLPGTPVFKYKDVISIRETFAEVSRKRETDGFKYGKTKTFVVNNTQVFAYTRLKSGNPGYLVAYNSENQMRTVDFSSISYIGNEVKVIARSSNSAFPGVDTTLTKLQTNAVTMAPKSTIVVSFITPGATA